MSLILIATLAFMISEFTFAPEADAGPAAGGALKISSLKWEAATTDISLVSASSFKTVRLKVKGKCTVKGSNKIRVTIKNTATGATKTAFTGKSGGNANFTFENQKNNAGSWKVISVEAVNRKWTKVGRRAGFWDSTGRWNAAADVYAWKSKSLKKLKYNKPAMKIVRGQDTSITLAGTPTSLFADETRVSLKATVRTAGGAAAAGQLVNFTVTPSSSAVAAVRTTAVTNAAGVASVVSNTPAGIGEFTVSAAHAGTARQYLPASTGGHRVTRPLVRTDFVLQPAWDGNTGTKTFKTQLVIAEGKDKGKPLVNVPVDWQFKHAEEREGVRLGALVHEVKGARTDATGHSSATITMKPNSAHWSD
ncbi:MAG: hypothetical protein FWE46_06680, partial [Coriobacteriia bacterium]|nr:hypothetical protein [Coriobacteriia bacterium]